MNKKILYLDMDGVVADFEKKIGELHPEIKDFRSVEYQKGLSEKIGRVCFANPEIYHNLPPILGAIEAVMKLSEIYEVYFLSKAMCTLPTSFTGKRFGLKNILETWEKRN